MEATHPFSFRGRESSAAVTYGANDDPERWGYGLLGLPWPSTLATGLPVLQVEVSTPAEGYAAVMGWIQVVRIHVAESSTSLVPGNESAPPEITPGPTCRPSCWASACRSCRSGAAPPYSTLRRRPRATFASSPTPSSRPARMR